MRPKQVCVLKFTKTSKPQLVSLKVYWPLAFDLENLCSKAYSLKW